MGGRLTVGQGWRGAGPARRAPRSNDTDGGDGQASDRRRTLKTSERVALEIVHDIVAQGLRTGDRLPLEAAMVEQYRVSRSSLRRRSGCSRCRDSSASNPALAGGPVVGTVEAANLARTATLYFHLEAATYHELLQTQLLLEPLCAELAAMNPARREAMAPFLEPAPLAPEADYRAATVDFHSAVYALTANPVLQLLTEAVTHIVTNHVLATMDPVELRPAIVDEHAVLARAIASGHAEKAHRVMTEHFATQHDY